MFETKVQNGLSWALHLIVLSTIQPAVSMWQVDRLDSALSQVVPDDVARMT